VQQLEIESTKGPELSFAEMSARWDAEKRAWADHEGAIKEHHGLGDLPPPGTPQADAEVMKLAGRELPKRKDQQDAIEWAREQYWLRYMHAPERQSRTLPHKGLRASSSLAEKLEEVEGASQ
jgi:hypothetical protein